MASDNMDIRGAVARLLELTNNRDLHELEEQIDDTAVALLSAICASLAFALAAARGRVADRELACEYAKECMAGVQMVLEVWQMADVEVVGCLPWDISALVGAPHIQS